MVHGWKFILITALCTFLISCNAISDKDQAQDKTVQEFEKKNLNEENSKEKQIGEVKPNGPIKEVDRGIIPSQIEIPSIGIKTDIENVERLENGEMGVPTSMETVGWFSPGVKPGDKGNAVVAGHVDSKTGPAVFYYLHRLKKGDEIIVSDQAGVSRVFLVVDKKSYPRESAPIEDIFGFSYTRNLNLITCTGEFNKKAGTHDERLVVYTVLKDEL
ncbi:class F sortase [Bacillus pinisoli]|uniref:class F sortase n=1 Tax=Bacillus pinisoli TaxID=2901866 RepID=UPI001FF34741|nr:class F sortase [Bacillus pinisoli]